MRTLIFGARGQLGQDLMRVFKSAGETFGLDREEADISNPAEIQPLVEQFAPDLIVNAAAYTNVEGAEEALTEAFLVNEIGARHVAEMAEYRRAPVIHFSTDFVFDGAAERPYCPEDKPAPLSVYGKSKLAGEAAVRKVNPRHFIVRTAWLYGPGQNNFVRKLLKAARERPSLRVVEDQVGSPSYTLDVAQAALALARTEAYGIYHAANTGECSRFEFAQEILRIAEAGTPVEPCQSSDLKEKAARPKYAPLDSSKLMAEAGYEMRPWQKALLDYLQREETS